MNPNDIFTQYELPPAPEVPTNPSILPQLASGSIAGDVKTDSAIQSPQFVHNETGYSLNPDGSAEFASGTFRGSVNAGAINIPDSATTDSFHVEADGDTFWGATPADFTSNNDNAPAYIYKTGAAKFQSVTVTGATVSRIQVPVSISGTAGEALTAGDAVCIGDGVGYVQSADTTPVSNSVARDTQWWSQSFTTSDHAVSIAAVVLKFTDSLGDPFAPFNLLGYTAHIYANSAGKPTGASLGNNTIGGPTGSAVTTSFSSPITVSASTTYHIVVQSTIASNRFNIFKSGGAGTGVNTSTDTGATWSTSTGPLYYQVVEIDTVAGRVHKTQTNLSRDRSNNFVGFALSTVSGGNSIDVSVTGVENTLSGLSAGSTYYLTDTKGAISTSPGTLTRKIGVAFSATQLIVKHDNV